MPQPQGSLGCARCAGALGSPSVQIAGRTPPRGEMQMSGTDSSYWTHLGASRLRRRRLLQGGAALSSFTALALLGCSSSNNSNKPTTSTAPAANNAPRANTAPAVATTARPATAAAGPSSAGTPSAAAQVGPTANPSLKTGGTINGSFVVANVPLNPFANTTYTSQDLVGFVYSRLFKFNSAADPNVTLSRIPVPDLVASY